VAATRGWERRKHALPLATGIYVHKGLEYLLATGNASEAAQKSRSSYLAEVEERGLAIEEAGDEQAVIEEQSALVEALVLAWARVRWPKWQAEYEVVEIEAEDRVLLSDDVTLAVRADAVVRRKYDHRLFVVNFKTVGTADERWMRTWEVDMQLMTELLAAERRHGHEFGGVIIEGLVKGRRMPVKDSVGTVIGYRDSSPLIWGYKCEADPPLRQLEYAWEYTKRKGWGRFAVWREHFPMSPLGASSAVDYWVNWLPEEVVEDQFITVPPIMRSAERIEAKVKQIVAITRQVELANATIAADQGFGLDEHYAQNERSCHYPSKCAMWDACWTHNVAEDMQGSGLYLPRKDHHAIEGGE